MKQFKRTISVVLALLMILGAFTALPVSAAQIDESENQSTGSSSDEGVVFITSEAELRGFASRVNNGDSMKNKTVYVAQGKSNEFTYYRQECNIEINRMVGSSSAPFSGRYDGDGYTLTFNTTTSDATGCAPFKVASTAVIQHVRTAGSIVANHKFASGLVAFGYNTLEITDCYSGIAIESNVEDDATHGGFVAVTGDDSNVKIEGCVFGGEMLGPASGGCGGIVGYARNNLTIKNCLFAPSGYFLGSETIASEPFVRIRYSDRVWLDNNYSTILFFPSERAGELFEITADSALDMRLRDYTEYKTSKTDKVAYGATPKYEGETPTKASDEQYHYTFSGWMPSVEAVTGNATYTASYTGTPRATLGDANGDGKVNVRDVTAIQRHASESELLTGDKLTAADVDGNGVVDIKDATAIQRYLAEFEGSYAVGTKI